MTKSEAKELSLKVWQYLRDHPGCVTKLDLPSKIYKEIADLYCHCPLCDCLKQDCYNCPLGDCEQDSYFNTWLQASSDEERQENAAGIVKLIEDWEV